MGGFNLHVKELGEEEKKLLKERFYKIKAFQERGECFSCHNFIAGDIFPDEGLIFYEDEKVRCQFEKYARTTGQTILDNGVIFIYTLYSSKCYNWNKK